MSSAAPLLRYRGNQIENTNSTSFGLEMNEDYATRAGKDLGVLLRNVASIDGGLSIHKMKESVPSEIPAFERILSSLEDQLKMRKSLLPSKTISLQKYMKERNIMKILSFFDPYTLSNIQLEDQIEDTPQFDRMDDLVKSEHWKRAKTLTIERSCDQPLKNFHHFDGAQFFIREFSAQELFELKEVRLQKGTRWRRRFEFKYQKMSGKEKLNTLLGGPPSVDQFGIWSTWLFPIPDKGAVLELKMRRYAVELMVIDKKYTSGDAEYHPEFIIN
ncbi:hypothetical protein CAEBREN_10139 [Caenorhabditis brenneri]|uniref:DUF38 domain-containing protein n=1 Tax=Caenorhabditis brenneri TaxID=135651 RepID=G0MG42_CAEBE|nr:hypothetical protein CAEBREN_10139 [Caenorhabditis brenneri]